jgi:uncharacterized cupin superfamily protein
LTGEQTGQAWALYEVVVPPEGGPPLHIHDNCEETMYLLEGELDLWIGGQMMKATPGCLIRVQRGTAHAYTNSSSTPARYLAWVTPAGFEKFFEEIDREVRRLPDDLAKVPAIAAKYQARLASPTE